MTTKAKAPTYYPPSRFARMKILRPLLGHLNQGALFTCARAERYAVYRVHGLVLTARCDLAQNKYPVLNYLPVVALDPWMHVDGFDILCHRARSDVAASIQNALDTAGISRSILHSQSPRTILQSIFKDLDADKKVKSSATRFADLVDHHEFLTHSATSAEAVPTLYKRFDKLRRGMLRELILNQLNGYYFLPRIYDDERPTGYVILMREVAHLPQLLASRIANGLEEQDAPQWSNHLSFRYAPFAMPIGEIPSPAIEHILQSFSFLFGRIGLPDVDQEYLADLCARQPPREAQ